LRRIFYRYLSVSNSVSIATDLATEMFLDFKLEITVSKSVSKATEILVAKYRSLIRLLKLRSDRFSNRMFFYSDAQNIGL
jgi:hypothetical protein